MSDAGETVRQFVASFEKRDAELIGTFFDDTIVFSNHGDPEVRGKENVVKFWKRAWPWMTRPMYSVQRSRSLILAHTPCRTQTPSASPAARARCHSRPTQCSCCG